MDDRMNAELDQGPKRALNGPLLGLAAAALLLSAPVASAQGQAQGWFTAEQAVRGNKVFTIECGGCHGYTLAEVLAEAETADRFYSFISTTMPWENPGALQRGQYADIVAFFLHRLGFVPGSAELPPDRQVMAQIVPASAPASAPEATAPAAAPASAVELAEADVPAAGGFYTAEQAEKGLRDFTVACGGCHGDDMVEIFQGYGTVGEYYRFVSGAMPADDPGNLAPRQYISVIAYLLRESGFPAGDTQLTNDRKLMEQIVPGNPGARSGTGASAAPAPAPAEAAQAAPAPDPAPATTDENAEAFYTAEQAEKGLRDFTVACGGCHGEDMVEIFQGYGTVGEYYRFVSGAMPADDPGNLAPRQYISVIAYLMRESGFPSGDTELTNDRQLMEQIVPGEPVAN